MCTMSLLKVNLNFDGGKHVLAMFLNKELFWMNNKTIIEFAFHIIYIVSYKRVLADLHISL